MNVDIEEKEFYKPINMNLSELEQTRENFEIFEQQRNETWNTTHKGLVEHFKPNLRKLINGNNN